MANKTFYPSQRQSRIAFYLNLLQRAVQKEYSPDLEQLCKELDISDSRLAADRHLLRFAFELEQVAHGPTAAAATAGEMLCALRNHRPDWFFAGREPPQLFHHPLGAEDPDDHGRFPSPYKRTRI